MGEFRKNAAHRLFCQTGIGIYSFGNGHARGQRLENESYGNTRVSHMRAAAKVLRVSYYPLLHSTNLPQSDERLKARAACRIYSKRLSLLFCFVSDVPQHAHVNAMDDGIRPEPPVGFRPETVAIPRGALEPCAAVGKRREQELTCI